jgi:hypothetical protein
VSVCCLLVCLFVSSIEFATGSFREGEKEIVSFVRLRLFAGWVMCYAGELIRQFHLVMSLESSGSHLLEVD